jgi:hypothetical protein
VVLAVFDAGPVVDSVVLSSAADSAALVLLVGAVAADEAAEAASSCTAVDARLGFVVFLVPLALTMMLVVWDGGV